MTHATKRSAVVPVLVSLLLLACGDKEAASTGSAAASGTAAAGKTLLTGVYKVTDFKRNEAACEEAGAAKAEPARKHLYLAATGAGRTQTWGAVSCDDPAGCTKDIAEYEKGASGEREVYELFGRETERNKLTGGTNFSGKWKEGQCSELHKTEASLALDGKKLTITVRKLVYDNFATGELSGCTVVEAEKQKVQNRCAGLEKLEAERLD